MWQLRVPVPKDVQEAFGRREVTRSLGERDRERAANAALAILADLFVQFEQLRNQSVSRAIAVVPSEHQLLALAGEAYQQARATTQQSRRDKLASGASDYDQYLQVQERSQVALVRAMEAQNFSSWRASAERMLRNRGFKVDVEAEWFQGFVQMVAEATVSAIDVANRRARGEISAEPASKVVQQAQVAASRQAEGFHDLPFENLAKEFMKSWEATRSGTKETNTRQQKEATLKLFGGFFANKSIRQVRGEHAARFHDSLKLFDPNWARSPATRNLSWGELEALYGTRPRGLADQTMNRHMRVLQEVWNWASKRGHCEGDNPFVGFNRKLKRGINVIPYVPWEIDDLKILFDPPPKRSDLTELMIVAMFTGMRLDEIASLTWGDLRVVNEGDREIAFFQIGDAKTPAGVRQVPLHPALAWILEREKGQAEQRLWPNFNDEGPGKKPGADAGREFSTFKLARGFRDRKKAYHSFRKNVTKIMERAGVPENEWAQVFGHERGFTYAVYNPDGIALARKAEIIGLIDYPGLSIPHPA